jgi:hypothetical protein
MNNLEKIESEEKNVNIFFKETFFIGALTVAAYFGAFIYKFCYLNYFNIDSIFVDVNLQDILSVNAFALLIMVAVANYIGKLIIKTKKDGNKARVAWLLILIFFLGLLPFLIVIFIKSDWVLLVLLITMGLFNLFQWLRDKNKYLSKYDDLFDVMESKLGNFLIIVFITLFVYFLYCSAAGFLSAWSKDVYLVTRDDQSVAVITSYDKNFLCLSYNPLKKSFFGDVIILTQEKISTNNIILINKKIGPLRRGK